MTDAQNAFRLPPRSSADTDGEVMRLLAKLEAVGADNLITRVLANSAQGFRPYVHMSNGLLNRASLPARVRELVILATARQQRVAYEWWEHVHMSAGAGVTDDDRRSLAADVDVHFSAAERLAIRIGRTLASGGVIDEADWQAGLTEWGADGLLDLVLTSAWWGGFVPTVVRALQLDDAVPSDQRPEWEES